MAVMTRMRYHLPRLGHWARTSTYLLSPALLPCCIVPPCTWYRVNAADVSRAGVYVRLRIPPVTRLLSTSEAGPQPCPLLSTSVRSGRTLESRGFSESTSPSAPLGASEREVRQAIKTLAQSTERHED